jgi:hypothetical protein
MPSKERELLEEISNGKMSWGPSDHTEAADERFDKVEATQITNALDNLIADDFIGDYSTHRESYNGKRRTDRILITKGLTFNGQDKSQWPE